MIYNGKELKKLGFGLMRLPMDGGAVDIEQVKRMVDVFMANGYTYFDTAHAYAFNGRKSEDVAKEVLINRYPRESFQIASKHPIWETKGNKQRVSELFNESLLALGVDYIDFYLLHNLGGDRTTLNEELDVWNYLIDQKNKGKIRKLGFSFHDNANALEEILQKHHADVDFVQLQINYSDWENLDVQSRLCYEVVRKYNKEIIVMEPIRGGALANPPRAVKDIFDASDDKFSYASWALRYVADIDGVFMILSGMSNNEQMNDNLDTFNTFSGKLSDSQRKTILKAQDAISKIKTIPCTNCQYCVKDCPMQINIPNVFGAMNHNILYDDVQGAKRKYAFATNEKGSASDCIQCGNCMSVCPQKIDIIEELNKISCILE